MQVHLITVGKLKDKNLESIETSYLKRIKNPELIIHEVRAKAEKKDLEAQVVLKKIQDISKAEKSFIVLLSEFGDEYHSPEFSKWLIHKIENYQHVIFIIAGAEGHGIDLLDKAHAKISLSKLTFPHKMARVIFVEQFYRALTIRDGHPYHN
jgi:23S rRNA (pseudouridine1915-N3)-methyltransferase